MFRYPRRVFASSSFSVYLFFWAACICRRAPSPPAGPRSPSPAPSSTARNPRARRYSPDTRRCVFVWAAPHGGEGKCPRFRFDVLINRGPVLPHPLLLLGLRHRRDTIGLGVHGRAVHRRQRRRQHRHQQARLLHPANPVPANPRRGGGGGPEGTGPRARPLDVPKLLSVRLWQQHGGGAECVSNAQLCRPRPRRGRGWWRRRAEP